MANTELQNIQEANAAVKVQRIQRGKEARREVAEKRRAIGEDLASLLGVMSDVSTGIY